MAKKRNIIVGQSGGPTAVINSSLAGVYKNAIERGFDKVYGMLHGIQGLLDEQYIDLSTQIHSELDIELLKRTPSAFLGSCRYKLPEIHEDKAIYEKIFPDFPPAKALEYSVKNLMFCHAHARSAQKKLCARRH